MSLRHFNVLGSEHGHLLFSFCVLEIGFLAWTAFELSREKVNYFLLTIQFSIGPKISSDHFWLLHEIKSVWLALFSCSCCVIMHRFYLIYFTNQNKIYAWLKHHKPFVLVSMCATILFVVHALTNSCVNSSTFIWPK